MTKANPPTKICKGKEKQRKKNFSMEEDVLLARAFAKTSLDKVKGADQKADDFWQAVFDAFLALQAKETGSKEVIEKRTRDLIRQRFQKILQPNITKFLAIKNTTKMGSGQSPDSFKEQLLEAFREKHGRPFTFYNCLEHLEDLPKFAKLKDPSEVAQMKMEEDSGVKTVVPDAARPEGAKKTAKRQKLEAMVGKSTDEANERVQKVVAAMDRVNATLKSKFKEDSVKFEMDSLIDQRDFFLKIGDTDGAKKLMKRLLHS
jgi:hypothetical protein